jgi:hypothetical protein
MTNAIKVLLQMTSVSLQPVPRLGILYFQIGPFEFPMHLTGAF